jgi:hypothetical protein
MNPSALTTVSLLCAHDALLSDAVDLTITLACADPGELLPH